MPVHIAHAATVASDVLYQPVLCATFDASALFAEVRRSGGTIPRIDARTKTSCADLPRSPCILSHAIDDWPALCRWPSLDALVERAQPESRFRAEASLCKMATYIRYAKTCAQDDSPLYLFHAAPLPSPLNADFSQPRIFDEDLFSLLGPDTRPDHLWLIVGPERSGSTFHQDPNGTSAWNAVVGGAKAWVCFDPDVVPPGVRVSADWAEVETPLSVAGVSPHDRLTALGLPFAQNGCSTTFPPHASGTVRPLEIPHAVASSSRASARPARLFSFPRAGGIVRCPPVSLRLS
jgi:hypothetical protein